MHLLNTLMGGVSSLGEGFSFPSHFCFYFTLMYSVGGKWSEEKGSIILVSRLIFDAMSGVAPKWVSTRLCLGAAKSHLPTRQSPLLLRLFRSQKADFLVT